MFERRLSGRAAIVTGGASGCGKAPLTNINGMTISQFIVLLPGDIITTGTPPGVGMGMKPPVYLNEGDVIELHIAKLGKQRHRVIGWNA